MIDRPSGQEDTLTRRAGKEKFECLNEVKKGSKMKQGKDTKKRIRPEHQTTILQTSH